MPLPAWETRQISQAGAVAAPAGSDVHILCAVDRGSSALFPLPPGAVAQSVSIARSPGKWVPTL
jgi:hypothetical protein